MNSVFSFVFRRLSQLILDILVFSFSMFTAYFIRFEGIIPASFIRQLLVFFPYIIVARIISFYAFSIYTIVWRYISIRDAFQIFRACLPVTAILVIGRYTLPAKLTFLCIPISIIVLEYLLTVTGASGIRMLRRLTAEMRARERRIAGGNNGEVKRVLLIGAGDAGNMVLKELRQRADLGLEVVAFVDDDPSKFHNIIQGVKVVGSTAQIPTLAERFKADSAIISIANASSRDIRRIVEICQGARIKVRIIPGLFEILDDKVHVNKIRDINIDDLLGRTLVNFDAHREEIEAHYRNKRILVTGAGGSIGSELCRQICVYWPSELILLDKDENSIFEIESELHCKFPGTRVAPVVANIKNRDRLNHIFQKYRPQVVFHAAAHKHVPLMEHNVGEAVINNVVGTANTAELAGMYGVERFIFISSDKAVNPTSVMGATKKIGEILIQNLAEKSGTKFACVRFGNVIGSRGSVVPLFQRQIANGGPVTVTHPDVRRYFMSISEAVQLIIQAGTVGEKGEIFVLDMGKLVKIKDLARDLMRLSGVREGDIEIKYTGMRPGEKLFEEILIDKERNQATRFEKIFVAPPVAYENGDFSKRLEELLEAAKADDEGTVVKCLQDMGIGYGPDRDRGFR